MAAASPFLLALALLSCSSAVWSAETDSDVVLKNALSENPFFRSMAQRRIRDMTPREKGVLVSQLADLSSDSPESSRIAALRALGEMRGGADEAFWTVLRVAEESEGDLQAAAIGAGIAIRPTARELAVVIAAVLGDEESHARRAVFASLAAMEKVPTPYQKFFIGALDSPSAPIRTIALKAIGRLEPRPSRPPPVLFELVTSKDSAEKIAAIRALVLWPNDARVKRIVETAASDGDEAVRREVRALQAESGRLDSAAFQRIAARLSDRETQAEALEEFAAYGSGAAPAFPLIVTVAEDPSSSLQAEAVAALGRIGPSTQDDYLALLRLAAQGPNSVRPAAELVLLRFKSEGAGAAALGLAVSSGAGRTKEVAERILASWSQRSKKVSEEFRRLAVDGVGGASSGALLCASDAGAATLAARLEGKEPRAAAEAAAALSRCGASAIAPLVKAVGSEDLDARTYALLALDAILDGMPLAVTVWGDASIGGVGIEVDVLASPPVVLRVHPGGPAEAGGLRARDVIEGVDGADAGKMSEDEFLSALRGPSGSEVRLLVRRNGADRLLTIPLTRAPVKTTVPRPQTTVGLLRGLGRYRLQAMPALKGLLASADPEVREEAAAALKEMGDGPAVGKGGQNGPLLSESEIIRRLKDSDVDVRMSAIVAAGGQKPTARLISALRRELEDPRSGVAGRHPEILGRPSLRHAIVFAFGKMGAAARGAVPDINRAIGSGDAQMRAIGDAALAEIGATGMEREFDLEVELRRFPDERAVQAMRDRIDDVTEPLLYRAAKGDKTAVRALAALCPEAVDSLLEALTSEMPRKVPAVEALASASALPASAADPLIAAARDSDPKVRANAVRALGRLPPQAVSKVLAAVNRALDDADPRVAAAARSVLQQRDSAHGRDAKNRRPLRPKRSAKQPGAGPSP